jgi:hypothetical protein
MLQLQRSVGNARLSELVSGMNSEPLVAHEPPTVQRFLPTEAIKASMRGHEGGEEGAAEGPEQAIAGGAFERTIEIPSGEMEAVPYGPVKLSAHGKVTFNGSLSHGKGGQLMMGAKGKEGFSEGEFEKEYETKYGTVKVGGSAEPGQKSALAVGFGGETYEIKFEAHANLKAPFSLGFEIKPHHKEINLGGWKFSGEISYGIEIDIGPNPKWILEQGAKAAGEEVLGEAAGEAAGEGVSGVAVETGEQGLVASAGGAALVGVGAGAAGVAWVALVAYEIGKADLEAGRLAVRKRYCNGYAEVLAMMTEQFDRAHPVRAYQKGQERELAWAMSANWSHQMEIAEKDYVKADDWKGRDAAAYRAHEAGKARATQLAMAYVEENGGEAWKDVIAEHLKKYGATLQERRQAYHTILYGDDGDNLPYIPIP